MFERKGIKPAVLPSLRLVRMSVHALIHILIITLASFMALLSILAFKRARRRQLFFVCLAFVLFAAREMIIFTEVVLGRSIDSVLPIIDTPLSHALSLMILLLFFLGVFPGRVV